MNEVTSIACSILKTALLECDKDFVTFKKRWAHFDLENHFDSPNIYNYLDWNIYIQIFKDAIRLTGDKGLELMAYHSVHGEKISALKYFNYAFFTQSAPYILLEKYFGAKLFKCVDFTYVQKNKDLLIYKISMKDDYQAIPEFFEYYRRIFSYFPTMIGSPASDVSMSSDGHNTAYYIIDLHESNYVKDFMYNSFNKVVQALKDLKNKKYGTEYLLREMDQANMALEVKTLELMKKNLELRNTNNLLDDSIKTLNESRNEKVHFIHLISHDISNSITSIYNSARSIKKRTARGLEIPTSRLDMIERHSLYVWEIIQQVKMFQSIDQGKFEYDLENVSVIECLEEMQHIFNEKLEEKSIRLKVNHDLDKNIQVKVCKSIFLNSVLGNLLSNAIKFSYEGSEIELSAKVSGSILSFIIRDYGLGIPDEIKNNLFKLDVATTRPGSSGEKGTGFGLPMTKFFVEKLGAKIHFHSYSGKNDSHKKGTEFRITFSDFSTGASTGKAPEILEKRDFLESRSLH